MTIDKFGSHLSQKQPYINAYYFCFIPLHIHELLRTFTLNNSTFYSYKINENSNIWIFPLNSATVEICRTDFLDIKFILNNEIVDTLEGLTLNKGDSILVVRPLKSQSQSNLTIELVLKLPVLIDEYD